MTRDYIGDYQSNNSNKSNNVLSGSQNGQQSKFPQLNGIMQLLGGFGGALGGGALGVGAGALIPGADLTGIPEAALGYSGGVTGAGVGAGAGNAGADWIRQNLLGDKTVDVSKTLPESVDAAKAGAVGQAIGGPLAKVLGVAMHPIATLGGKVDNILAKSPKSVDFFKYLDKVGKEGVDALAAKGVGQQAQKSFTDTLAPNLRAAAQQAVQHISGSGEANNVIDQGIPVAAANYLKRNLSSGLQYGEMGKPSEELTKTAVKYLGDAIKTEEPGIAKYNNAMHYLYKVPETLSGLSQVFSFGNPKASAAISMLSKLPGSITNKIVPQEGGYLTQVLPRALQMLFGATSGRK